MIRTRLLLCVRAYALAVDLVQGERTESPALEHITYGEVELRSQILDGLVRVVVYGVPERPNVAKATRNVVGDARAHPATTAASPAHPFGSNGLVPHRGHTGTLALVVSLLPQDGHWGSVFSLAIFGFSGWVSTPYFSISLPYRRETFVLLLIFLPRSTVYSVGAPSALRNFSALATVSNSWTAPTAM